MTDLPLLISVIALLLAVGVNSHNYSKESQYIKNKYINKGYDRGYKQATKDYETLERLKQKR